MAEVNDDLKNYLQNKYSDQMNAYNQQLQQINEGQAFANLGDVIAGQKVGSTAPMFQAQREQAKQQTIGNYDLEQQRKLQDIALKKATEESDPSSQRSQTFRKVIEQNYPNLVKSYGEEWKNVSAGEKENIWDVVKTKATLDEKLEQQRLRNDILRSNQSDRLALKQSDADIKEGQKLDKHLSLGWAGRAGQAGQIQNKINSAEAAEALIQQGANQKNGLDSRQIEELAQSTSKLLGSGTNASARVEALIPHTLTGRIQSIQEFLTNEPQGAKQQEFIKRLAETVQREKELAIEQQRKYQIEGLPQFSALKARNPQLYNSILQSKGIDESMIDEKGRYKKATGVPSMSGGGYPKKVMKGNQSATVNNAQEEKEANAEGFQ